MMKQLISLLLCNALVVLLCTSSFGVSFQGEKEAKEIANVKTRIEKLGRTTRVEIKLRNRNKLKGYVQQIAEDHVVISDPKTNTWSSAPAAVATIRASRRVGFSSSKAGKPMVRTTA